MFMQVDLTISNRNRRPGFTYDGGFQISAVIIRKTSDAGIKSQISFISGQTGPAYSDLSASNPAIPHSKLFSSVTSITPVFGAGNTDNLYPRDGPHLRGCAVGRCRVSKQLSFYFFCRGE